MDGVPSVMSSLYRRQPLVCTLLGNFRVKYFTLSFEYDVVSLFGELKVIFCKELQFLNAELDMFVIEGGKKTSFKDEQL